MTSQPGPRRSTRSQDEPAKLNEYETTPTWATVKTREALNYSERSEYASARADAIKKTAALFNLLYPSGQKFVSLPWDTRLLEEPPKTAKATVDLIDNKHVFKYFFYNTSYGITFDV